MSGFHWMMQFPLRKRFYSRGREQGHCFHITITISLSGGKTTILRVCLPRPLYRFHHHQIISLILTLSYFFITWWLGVWHTTWSLVFWTGNRYVSSQGHQFKSRPWEHMFDYWNFRLSYREAGAEEKELNGNIIQDVLSPIPYQQQSLLKSNPHSALLKCAIWTIFSQWILPFYENTFIVICF